MNSLQIDSPQVCVLTQTASNVSDYYRQLFAGFDLFYVTYKEEQDNAVDFLPGSTWSDGRNRLWDHVKGKYDYYLFIDDDLEFFNFAEFVPGIFGQGPYRVQQILGRSADQCFGRLFYEKATPATLKSKLLTVIKEYRPMVASFRTLSNTIVDELDRHSLTRNRRVRPAGWFDAQVTLLSNRAAEFLLPYDTSFSGWWSSQIPIYCLSHLAFGERALYILDLAAHNTRHNTYKQGYDGYQDILEMATWLSRGLNATACGPLHFENSRQINYQFAARFAKEKVTPGSAVQPTLEEILQSLDGSFNLYHPYLHERHQNIIARLCSSECAQTIQ